MKADLHLHTTASDGKLSPGELVALAARLGLEAMAITDHDSVDGLEEAFKAAQDFPGLTVIPGVEISADIPRDEVHILGYFVDLASPELGEALCRQRASRHQRAQRMVEKLSALGLPLSWERVLEIAAGAPVGRPHIAQALLEKGHIASLNQAFQEYIGRNGPAYVEREKITPTEAVSLIAQARGLPVLAHPASLLSLKGLLKELAAAGLGGLEAYYPGYSPETSRNLEALARKHRLLLCGGSDYHGLDQSREAEPGSVPLPEAAVRRFLAWGGWKGS